METVLETSAEELREDALHPIDLNFLQPGEPLSFPIYARIEKRGQEAKYSLLLNRGHVLTNGIKQMVEVGPGTKVYTSRDNLDDFNKYIDAQIAVILSNETIPLTERSEILYSLGAKAMEEVFLGDVQRDAFDSAVRFAANLSDFLDSNEDALFSFIKLSSKDYRLFDHSVQVCVLGLSLFYQTLYDEKPDLVSDVAVGLLFHDIGKTRIEKKILEKSGFITPIEWKIMKRHPVWGADILKEAGVANSVTETIVRSHHERLDGQGYPDGLKSLQVSPLSQIATLANRFAYLTSNRPYKLGVSAYKAFELMIEENQEDFWVDSSLLKAFMRTLGGSGCLGFLHQRST